MIFTVLILASIHVLLIACKNEFFQHIFMKKNRPAILVTLLCSSEKINEMTTCIFQHTSTFGFRYRSQKRKILRREWIEMETDIGVIRIKMGYDGDICHTTSIEYEDIKRYAQKKSISLMDARTEILSMWQQHTSS